MVSDTANSLEDDAVELLGGEKVFGFFHTPMDIHRALHAGLPASARANLRSSLRLIADDPAVLALIGAAPRTGRHSRSRSNQIWAFARLLAKATATLGGRAAAEGWFARPAMALDRRRPIDLLSTSIGAQMVDDHLTRMEFGVHT